MAFRAQYRESVFPIPDVWSHDAWIALLISLLSDVEIIREPLILYRQHSENQIGVAALKDRAARWKGKTFADRCLKRIAKYELAYERIMTSKNLDGIGKDSIERLASKIQHLKERYEISKAGWRGVPIAIRELLLFRYHRFSERDRAFLADIFRSNKKALQ
jgi:hypothetical protein